MFVNIIKTYRDIVAICDSDLIGKKFVEGEFQLDIKESFFKGKEESTEKVREIMTEMIQEDATFNIIGEESTKTALEVGIISVENIKKIQGIPFALILK
jgi:hypothetical protein|tara:strand:+ start:21546 stop:21842 length:297 start_codon:yes stop_codon:yes gene_type:complete